MKEVKIRENNTELRTGLGALEIVLWEGDRCRTLAYWIMEAEGYSLKFILNRFLDANPETTSYLMSLGQQILDKQYSELVIKS